MRSARFADLFDLLDGLNSHALLRSGHCAMRLFERRTKRCHIGCGPRDLTSHLDTIDDGFGVRSHRRWMQSY